jgi:ribosomal protein S18 acetylase RimI-like enzyme
MAGSRCAGGAARIGFHGRLHIGAERMSDAERIVEARTHAEIARFRELIEEYAASLGFDLGFQDFERELAELPGEYDPILVAFVGHEAAGCVALRSLEPGSCEMKRLYVRPAYRGSGLGRRLAEAVVAAARARRYQTLRLDTIPSMDAARSLYRTLGFKPIPPYRFNPIPGTEFLELQL